MENNVKIINCVNCPKFCQKEDFNKLRRLLDKLKVQGHEEVKFNCEAGQQIIKKFTAIK